jgi:hypothetical protein
MAMLLLLVVVIPPSFAAADAVVAVDACGSLIVHYSVVWFKMIKEGYDDGDDKMKCLINHKRQSSKTRDQAGKRQTSEKSRTSACK